VDERQGNEGEKGGMEGKIFAISKIEEIAAFY